MYQSESAKRKPLIVEFTFEYKVRENKKKMIIEEFPLTLVKNTYEFHKVLQDRRIVELNASTTKPGFCLRKSPQNFIYYSFGIYDYKLCLHLY